MVFIRTKKINKNTYAYLVENIKTSKGPRQKVKQYLGRVYTTQNDGTRQENIITSKNKTDFLKQLIIKELHMNGFTKKGNNFEFDTVLFSPKSLTLQKKRKNVVVKLNEGHLCQYTLKQITTFKKIQDISKDGFMLAKHLLEAGLNISEEEFIKFYKLH